MSIDLSTIWLQPQLTESELRSAAAALVIVGDDRHGPSVVPALLIASHVADQALHVAIQPEEPGLDDDERRAWLWFAACLGHPEAIKQIGVLVQVEAVKRSADPAQSQRLLRLAETWFAKIRKPEPGRLRPDHGPEVEIPDTENA